MNIVGKPGRAKKKQTGRKKRRSQAGKTEPPYDSRPYLKRGEGFMSSSPHTHENKANTKNGILRGVFVGIALILEILLVFGILKANLGNYAEIIAILIRILGLFLVLGIYSQNKTGSIKIPWIILILIFPAIGVSLYLLIGLSGTTRFMRMRYDEMDEKLMPLLVQDEEVLSALDEGVPSCAGISRYLLNESGYPVYCGTEVTYFDDAAKGIAAQKEDMKQAKSFIFMEYFAIEDKESWQEVEDILAEKAAESLDVRVFYDDIGSIGYINVDFVKKLEKRGIRCRVFNPMLPFLNVFLNNRDHRKMTIIDGKVGYTGGYNIANEYFNITHPFGHWKDTGVRLEGEAVPAMTATFLSSWNAVRADDEDDVSFQQFFPETSAPDAVGCVQFYADSPMDQKPVGEDVYISMADRAQKYLYIITPYLIITEEMTRSLNLAAKRGVDVRIITPGIPDKKLVYRLTRSFYSQLAENGVRIFEYTPGFCHAKMSVADDVVATCGTINLDYRSLYHHFECGALMIGSEAVIDIRDDFLQLFPQCEEVTEKYSTGRSAGLRLGQMILRLFAPLM